MSQKQKNSSEKKELKEFLRYIVIGVSTTIINWGVNIIFNECTSLGNFDEGATIAAGIAWVLSTVFFAFWAYKFFVFRSKSMKRELLVPEFISFTSARLLTLVVEMLITYICCTIIGLDHKIHFGFTRLVDGVAAGSFGIEIKERYIVKLCACVITTILNYIFSKLIIFKKGQKMSEESESEEDEGEKA